MTRQLFSSIALIGTVILAGCATHSPESALTSQPAATTNQPTGPADDQTQFDSPDAAVAAFRDAAQKQDASAMRKIFGPDWDDLQTGDKVADANRMKSFAQHVGEQLRAEPVDEDTATIYIGKNDWPMPIPLERGDNHKWYFDTTAGKATILARRIGADELAAIDFCHTYVFAQREYATQDHDGTGVLKYAQRFVSHPRKEDGLFWQVEQSVPTTQASDDEFSGAPEIPPQSPLGPLVAQAENEGYEPSHGMVRRPFHGYYFRILKRQGADAPGGKYEYIINGNMIGGFALIAWPDKYGSSGVMTFIVNHRGQIFQKDLGEKTDELARQIKEYDPDKSWTPVK